MTKNKQDLLKRFDWRLISNEEEIKRVEGNEKLEDNEKKERIDHINNTYSEYVVQAESVKRWHELMTEFYEWYPKGYIIDWRCYQFALSVFMRLSAQYKSGNVYSDLYEVIGECTNQLNRFKDPYKIFEVAWYIDKDWVALKEKIIND